MIKTEQQYLEAIRSGNSKVLREIYRQFLPRIKALITRNGGNEEDALDIFQEAIVVIYEKSKNPDFKLTSGFYTLLYGVCRNMWGNRLQKKSRSEVTIEDDHKYMVSDDMIAAIYQEEERRLFWDAFQKLGAECQKVMRMFFDKIKMTEIAERLGFASVSYAKKRKFQCKERLVNFVKADRRFGELNKN